MSRRSGGRTIDLSRAALISLAIVGTSLLLTLGYLMKKPCMGGPGFKQGDQYRKNCYSDIIFLYGDRNEPFHVEGKDRGFTDHGLAYRDANVEYPAVTGLFISTVNSFVAKRDVAGFLRLNALGLSLFALAAAAALAAVASQRWRVALFALAPAVLSYAFHNWDLLPVGFFAVGVWAFVHRRDTLAGVMLGLGAAAKVFPGLAVPAFMLARRRQGDRVMPLFAAAVIAFAVPNVLVMLFAGVDGWWFPWKFQGERFPNYETLSFFIYHHGSRWWPTLGNDFWFGADGNPSPFARIFQLTSMVAFAAGSLFLLWREWRRDRFRPYATAMGIVIIFLLTAKVYSPQYSLWLLPFFVVVGLSLWTYALFVVTDFLVLSLIWAYFTAYADGTATEAHLLWLEAGVYIRYAALAVILWQTRRSEDKTIADDRTGERPAAALWDAQPTPDGAS